MWHKITFFSGDALQSQDAVKGTYPSISRTGNTKPPSFALLSIFVEFEPIQNR